MRYLESITDFFKSPNWFMNLLLGSVCIAIPVVGALVYIGYNIGVFVQQHHQPNILYADFKFDRFADYLTRGVWPFLVQLVVGLLLTPLAFVFMVPMYIAMFSNEEELFIVFLLFGVVMQIAISIAIAVFIAPMTIGASLTQSFGGGFNWPFIRDFIRRVWGTVVLVMLFLMAISIPLSLIGLCTCYIGLFPAMALMTFAQWQLNRQLYELYLQRGGTPLAIKPELFDAPPGDVCLHCGYDLRGTIAAGGQYCPECGTPFQHTPYHQPPPPPPVWPTP